MKKIITLSILSLSIFLISCGSATINTETTITNDHVSNINIILTYDALVKDKLGTTILKDITASDLEVKSSYDNQNKMYLEELVLSKDNINNLLSNSKLNEYLSIETNKSTSLFKNQYTFNIKFLSDLSSLVDSNISTYLAYIPFNNKIIIPGKLLSSNSNNIINENTLEWTYTLDQINSTTNLQFEYEVYSISRILLFILITITLIAITIYLVRKNKKNNI